MLTLSPTARHLVFSVAILLASTLATGCSGFEESVDRRPDRDTAAGDTADQDTSDVGTTPEETDVSQSSPQFHVCDDAPQPSGLDEVDWNNLTSGAIAAADPYHTARDRITNLDRRVDLAGKFSYGAVQKDLEGESIGIWIDDCSGSYRRVARKATDDDGRVRATIDPETLPTPGRYTTYFRVRGDGTSTTGSLRVLPEDTEMVVFDIDGTLTQGNRELANDIVTDLFEPLLGGDYVPEPRADATRATAVYRETLGYQVAYLTARPYWLDRRTRQWLDGQDMAPGALRLTPSVTDGLPTDSSVGEFKAGYLDRLINTLGLDVRRAYGNSTTDIYGYANGGLSKKNIYMIGDHAGEQGTVAVDGYPSHIDDVEMRYAPADQPFHY